MLTFVSKEIHSFFHESITIEKGEILKRSIETKLLKMNVKKRGYEFSLFQVIVIILILSQLLLTTYGMNSFYVLYEYR